MRNDRELGVIALCVILGFSVGGPNILLFSNIAILSYTTVNWYFFATGALSSRQWWLLKIVTPASLCIYLIRSYLSTL